MSTRCEYTLLWSVEEYFRDICSYAKIPGPLPGIISLKFMCIEGRICLIHLVSNLCLKDRGLG
jgi:hypothetical protein